MLMFRPTSRYESIKIPRALSGPPWIEVHDVYFVPDSVLSLQEFLSKLQGENQI